MGSFLNLLSLYVGSEYANKGEKKRMISHSGVCAQAVVDSEGVWDSGCVRGLCAEMRWRKLTGTLGSDTAMLSG